MAKPFGRAWAAAILTLTLVGSVGLVNLSSMSGSGAAASTLPSPPLAKGGLIEATSCVTGPTCITVGWNHHGNLGYTWAARWQHGRWSKIAAPRDDPSAISCVSSTWCMATGSKHERSGYFVPFSEVLNGTRWVTFPLPIIKGSKDLSLYEVNCRSRVWCIGVGSYVANKPHYTDATFLTSMTWNGSRWAPVPIFSPRTYAHQVDPGMVLGGAHPTAVPQQLSCVSASFCVIAGFWTSVFVEQWNGHMWREVSAPNAPNRFGPNSEFSGGTCTSTRFCVATGGYNIANGVWRPLIDQWNGTTWSNVALPAFTKSNFGRNGFRLSRVACSSPMYCIAFGDAGFPDLTKDSMVWNGRIWSYSLVGISSGRPSIICLTAQDCRSTF